MEKRSQDAAVYESIFENFFDNDFEAFLECSGPMNRSLVTRLKFTGPEVRSLKCKIRGLLENVLPESFGTFQE